MLISIQPKTDASYKQNFGTFYKPGGIEADLLKKITAKFTPSQKEKISTLLYTMVQEQKEFKNHLYFSANNNLFKIPLLGLDVHKANGNVKEWVVGLTKNCGFADLYNYLAVNKKIIKKMEYGITDDTLELKEVPDKIKKTNNILDIWE